MLNYRLLWLGRLEIRVGNTEDMSSILILGMVNITGMPLNVIPKVRLLIIRGNCRYQRLVIK